LYIIIHKISCPALARGNDEILGEIKSLPEWFLFFFYVVNYTYYIPFRNRLYAGDFFEKTFPKNNPINNYMGGKFGWVFLFYQFMHRVHAPQLTLWRE